MPLLQGLAGPGRPPKILLLGSGGLSIGQAGEFDYSGTQAIKAIVEEGATVIVVNPNIATVQTNPDPNIKVYLYPVTPDWVERVIAAERPDAVVAGFGGQTALNCLLELDAGGVLRRYGVRNLGTDPTVLKMTEDRDAFAAKMKDLGMPVPPSFACNSLDQALAAAGCIGYPVILRAAYALGGLGSGFANNENELSALVLPALACSPQVLVERSLRGFKEVEYEVMRDNEDNTITICNMENFDPLGIHTGDSIVVAPSQTLSDDEYQLLRGASIRIVQALGVIGECNVQFALHPSSHEFYVIEVNARLSRSSALASKATGYPIAYIAAKVVMGYDLLELKNPVTGITFAYFEPALDYIAIKVPRWDLCKFHRVNRKLGSTMKSVGEIMAIGRSFAEAMQKAARMVTENPVGLSATRLPSTAALLHEELAEPTENRLYALMDALRGGMGIDEAHALTRIDRWFLYQLMQIVKMEQELLAAAAADGAAASGIERVTQVTERIAPASWRTLKAGGFGDEQIAALILRRAGDLAPSERIIQDASLLVRKRRVQCGVVPVVKRIDTTAAEYPSPSNYLYVTYGGSFHDPLPDDGKVFSAVVLGGGAYRIGASVEFDWCAVSCSRRLQHAGWRSIVINCNPETVSTDYNASDRLYFEELSLERILDIVDLEHAVGVIASMGGQLPNRLALPLVRAGVKLLGHGPAAIDTAEDRSKFSALLDRLGIDQPRWVAARGADEVQAFVRTVGYPVIVRPSYVLSGAAMNVVHDDESLTRCLALAVDVSGDHPIVVSEFIEGAREIELDGVAADGAILTAIVSEHIENAGVHSGDATTVVPAQKLYVETVRQVRRAGHMIARGLHLNGPFNLQFLAREQKIKVIECNARAARSFPFVSKTVGINLADVATDISIGATPNLKRFNEDDLPFVGVKAAMFSFARLAGADPQVGVEMASTGEVGCIGKDVDEAVLLSLEATSIRRPRRGVLVSSGTEKDKLRFCKAASFFAHKLGLPLYATHGTSEYLKDHGFAPIELAWPDEAPNDALQAIREGRVDLVINIPKNSRTQELTHGSRIRQAAVRYNCSLLTNMEKVLSFVQALERYENFVATHELLVLPPYKS